MQYKKSDDKGNWDLVNIILVAIPLTVALFMVFEGVVWDILIGHPLIGIPASLGLMSMVVSCIGIPAAIARGAK